MEYCHLQIAVCKNVQDRNLSGGKRKIRDSNLSKPLSLLPYIFWYSKKIPALPGKLPSGVKGTLLPLHHSLRDGKISRAVFSVLKSIAGRNHVPASD